MEQTRKDGEEGNGEKRGGGAKWNKMGLNTKIMMTEGVRQEADKQK